MEEILPSFARTRPCEEDFFWLPDPRKDQWSDSPECGIEGSSPNQNAKLHSKEKLRCEDAAKRERFATPAHQKMQNLRSSAPSTPNAGDSTLPRSEGVATLTTPGSRVSSGWDPKLRANPKKCTP